MTRTLGIMLLTLRPSLHDGVMSVPNQSVSHGRAGNPQPLGDLSLIAVGHFEGLLIKFTLGPFAQRSFGVASDVALSLLQQLRYEILKSRFGFCLSKTRLTQRLSDGLDVDRVTVRQ